jgi:hypothetical protein
LNLKTTGIDDDAVVVVDDDGGGGDVFKPRK